MSFCIDIYLYLKFRKTFNAGAIIALSMEMLDILDWIFLGKLDVFGWIEIIPFWIIICADNVRSEVKRNDESPLIPNRIPIEQKGKKCSVCDQIATIETEYCEHCGATFR